MISSEIQNVYAVHIYVYGRGYGYYIYIWKRRDTLLELKGKYVKGLMLWSQYVYTSIHTGISVSEIPTNTVVRITTYLGIHILFGKVMSRILWAVVLLSSKLSLTEIYIAGMTYKWNFWMWKCSTSRVL